MSFLPLFFLFPIYVALCLELEQSSVPSPYYPAQFTGLRLSVSAMCHRWLGVGLSPASGIESSLVPMDSTIGALERLHMRGNTPSYISPPLGYDV